MKFWKNNFDEIFENYFNTINLSLFSFNYNKRESVEFKSLKFRIVTGIKKGACERHLRLIRISLFSPFPIRSRGEVSPIKIEVSVKKLPRGKHDRAWIHHGMRVVYVQNCRGERAAGNKKNGNYETRIQLCPRGPELNPVPT